MKPTQVNQGSKYTDQDRRSALACYAVHGNFSRCQDLIGIPSSTMSTWSTCEWWLSALDEVRHEKQNEIDSGIQKIIDRAINGVIERLDKGDEMITSKGETLYKAVSARDSATILGIAFDKQRILRNLPTSITSNTDSAKLLKLQEQFEILAHEKTRQIEASIVAEG